MNKISIIGASGFIGRNLCEYLFKINEDFCGYSRSISDARLNITKLNQYSEVPQSEFLVYLAEESQVSIAESCGESYIENSLRALKEIHNSSKSTIIYISSALVYGKDGIKPFKISEPLSLGSIYTKSKAVCEKYVIEHGGSVARLTNVYGKGMSASNVFSDILRQIHSKEVVTLQNLFPIRDYVSVKDVVKCLHLICIKDLNRIFNVGSGRPLSVKELAEIIMKENSISNPQIQQTDMVNDCSQLLVDIQETIAYLDWLPEVDLGLESKALKSNL